jgi:hypothetical protein
LLARQRYPRLAQSLRLVHPQNTEEYFAYWPDTGRRFELNEVCFRIMGLMTGENEVESICDVIKQEFEDSASVTSDVEDLLKELVKEGCVIIEKRSSP